MTLVRNEEDMAGFGIRPSRLTNPFAIFLPEVHKRKLPMNWSSIPKAPRQEEFSRMPRNIQIELFTQFVLCCLSLIAVICVLIVIFACKKDNMAGFGNLNKAARLPCRTMLLQTRKTVVLLFVMRETWPDSSSDQHITNPFVIFMPAVFDWIVAKSTILDRRYAVLIFMPNVLAFFGHFYSGGVDVFQKSLWRTKQADKHVLIFIYRWVKQISGYWRTKQADKHVHIFIYRWVKQISGSGK